MSQKADVAEEDLLMPVETGELARVSTQTLANWRAAKTGPPYLKLSTGRAGRVRYRRADVLRWLSEREVAA